VQYDTQQIQKMMATQNGETHGGGKIRKLSIQRDMDMVESGVANIADIKTSMLEKTKRISFMSASG
jgi:hypothetical protein